MRTHINILALGDVVGKCGKAGVRKAIRELRGELAPDLIVVNGENISGGLGIEAKCFGDLRSFGADLITLGDHAFQKRGSDELLEKNKDRIVRPANFPPGIAGSGFAILEKEGLPKIGIVNLLGRVFIEKSLDCPFRCLDSLLLNELADCPVILVDFHAEATSEKAAMAHHFDGRITMMWGTHTHVQTNDARILEHGTGFISDLGMCGAADSIIGMDKERAIYRLLTGLPAQYKAGKGNASINGVFAKISLETFKVSEISTVSTIARL